MTEKDKLIQSLKRELEAARADLHTVLDRATQFSDEFCQFCRFHDTEGCVIEDMSCNAEWRGME